MLSHVLTILYYKWHLYETTPTNYASKNACTLAIHIVSHALLDTVTAVTAIHKAMGLAMNSALLDSRIWEVTTCTAART